MAVCCGAVSVRSYAYTIQPMHACMYMSGTHSMKIITVRCDSFNSLDSIAQGGFVSWICEIGPRRAYFYVCAHVGYTLETDIFNDRFFQVCEFTIFNGLLLCSIRSFYLLKCVLKIRNHNYILVSLLLRFVMSLYLSLVISSFGTCYRFSKLFILLRSISQANFWLTSKVMRLKMILINCRNDYEFLFFTSVNSHKWSNFSTIFDCISINLIAFCNLVHYSKL